MKNESDVIAARLLKELSELDAAIADDAENPDPKEVHEMHLGLVAGFLGKEYALTAEKSQPIAARILEELSELHTSIRASKGFGDRAAVHEQRLSVVANVVRKECGAAS